MKVYVPITTNTSYYFDDLTMDISLFCHIKCSKCLKCTRKYCTGETFEHQSSVQVQMNFISALKNTSVNQWIIIYCLNLRMLKSVY